MSGVERTFGEIAVKIRPKDKAARTVIFNGRWLAQDFEVGKTRNSVALTETGDFLSFWESIDGTDGSDIDIDGGYEDFLTS